MTIEQNGSGGNKLVAKPTNGANNGGHAPGDEAPDRVRSIYPSHKTETKPATEAQRRSTTTGKASEGDLVASAGVKFKGEIAACDTLVVEGEIEAQLKSRQIVIAQTGNFVGRAEVEDAEIAGRFEGTLSASGKLIIRRTGRLQGHVSYGQLEIEPGGELRGKVDVQFGTKKLGILGSTEKTWSWM